MWYGYAADAVVAIHVAYIAYVVLGQLALVVGAALQRDWARNPWFRFTHLAAIGIVAIEEWFGWRCPLTVWEHQLRALGGQTVEQGSFLGRFLHDLLFVDDHLSEDAITVMHYAFAALVVQALVMYPPRLWRCQAPQNQPAVAAQPQPC